MECYVKHPRVSTRGIYYIIIAKSCKTSLRHHITTGLFTALACFACWYTQSVHCRGPKHFGRRRPGKKPKTSWKRLKNAGCAGMWANGAKFLLVLFWVVIMGFCRVISPIRENKLKWGWDIHLQHSIGTGGIPSHIFRQVWLFLSQFNVSIHFCATWVHGSLVERLETKPLKLRRRSCKRWIRACPGHPKKMRVGKQNMGQTAATFFLLGGWWLERLL